MMKSKSAQVLFHVIGIAIFLSLPIIFWPGQGDLSDFFNDDRALRGLLSDILFLGFFYLNFYFFIPKFYFRKKHLVFIIVLLLSFLVIVFLPDYLFPFQNHGHMMQGLGNGDRLSQGPKNFGNHFFFSTGHHLVFFLAIVFFSLMLKLNNRWRQAEKERLKAELSYFKAQINPHFLFNTLNTIYSLAIQNDGNTAEAVVKLSGMMRYVISDASSDFVSLEKEISYISDYIELQRIRFGDTVKIDYNPCQTDEGQMIAPLILIPFIENAFKFGVNPTENSYISIDISLSESELHMQVFNYKVNGRDESEKTGGLGIINTRQRLALLYPEKHRLSIGESSSEYRVNLFIILE